MENEKEVINLFTKEIWFPDSITIEMEKADYGNRTLILIFNSGRGKETIKITCSQELCKKLMFANLDSDKDTEVMYHFTTETGDVYVIKYHNFILINDMVFKHTGSIKPAKEITEFKGFCDAFGMCPEENPKIARDTENTNHLKITRGDGTVYHFNEDYSSRYVYLAVMED